MNTRQLARRTDPDTSHIAAESVHTFAAAQRAAIVLALSYHGPMGKDGIAAKTGMHGTQVDRRVKEIQKEGLIALTGKTVLSDAGKPEREWRVVVVDLDAIKAAGLNSDEHSRRMLAGRMEAGRQS